MTKSLKFSTHETYLDVAGFVNKVCRTKKPCFLDYSWSELSRDLVVYVNSGCVMKLSPEPVVSFVSVIDEKCGGVTLVYIDGSHDRERGRSV